MICSIEFSHLADTFIQNDLEVTLIYKELPALLLVDNPLPFWAMATPSQYLSMDEDFFFKQWCSVV